jgi:hypothetical protein
MKSYFQEREEFFIDMHLQSYCSRCPKERCLDKVLKTRGVIECRNKPSVDNLFYKSAPIDFEAELGSSSMIYTWTDTTTVPYDVKKAEDFGL